MRRRWCARAAHVGDTGYAQVSRTDLRPTRDTAAELEHCRTTACRHAPLSCSPARLGVLVAVMCPSLDTRCKAILWFVTRRGVRSAHFTGRPARARPMKQGEAAGRRPQAALASSCPASRSRHRIYSLAPIGVCAAPVALPLRGGGGSRRRGSGPPPSTWATGTLASADIH